MEKEVKEYILVPKTNNTFSLVPPLIGSNSESKFNGHAKSFRDGTNVPNSNRAFSLLPSLNGSKVEPKSSGPTESGTGITKSADSQSEGTSDLAESKDCAVVTVKKTESNRKFNQSKKPFKNERYSHERPVSKISNVDRGSSSRSTLAFKRDALEKSWVVL